jgi:hypothetical protein
MAYCPKCKEPVLSEFAYAHICPSPFGANTKDIPALANYNALCDERDRRLSRYDEAVRLLRDTADQIGVIADVSIAAKIEAFLAAEPQKGEKG